MGLVENFMFNSLETVKKKEAQSEEERERKIKELGQEVEKRRKEYLEKDYKKNKVATRLNKSIDAFLKKDKKEAGLESDKELAECRAYYDNSLLEYKKAVLDNVRRNGATHEEIIGIANFYQVEANINLADVHDQVKIENQEGKIFGFFKERSKELVEKYKKMHWANKMAIGAAFGLAGVGAIYIGGVAVGIAGSAITARRAVMGVITGTTVSLGFEARGKRKTAEKNKKEMKGLENSMIGLNQEKRFDILEEFINKSIQDEDRKIDKIKNKNLRQLVYGVAAGVGVLLVPKIVRMLSKSTGLGSFVQEYLKGKSIPIEESPIGETGVTDQSTSELPVPPEQDTFKEINPKAKVGQIEIEVQEGDSLWKIIGKQLGEKYQDYANLDGAKKTYVINALKDKMAEDPKKFGLDNIDKLKIGQKIDLSAIFDGKESDAGNFMEKAQVLSEDQTGSILENNQKLNDWINTHPGEGLTLEKTTEILKGESTGPGRLGMTDAEIKTRLEAEATEKNLEAANIDKEPEAGGLKNLQTEKEPEIQFEKETSELTEEAHRIIEKSADELGNKIAGVNMFDDEGFFTGGSAHWDKIKDIKYSDIQSEGSLSVAPYVKFRLGEIIVSFKEKLGSEGIPRPDEKLKDWLERLIGQYGKDKIPSLERIIEKYGSRSSER